MLMAERTVVVFVDLQDRLIPAIDAADHVVERARVLAGIADRLDIACIVTEHVPRAIGYTVDALSSLRAASIVVEKTSFSACGTPSFTTALGNMKADHVLVCGTETHVCVQQTVLDLLDRGFSVAVAADATGSRKPEDRQRALDRMARRGADIVTVEMAGFEWLRRADHPAFKDVLALIK